MIWIPRPVGRTPRGYQWLKRVIAWLREREGPIDLDSINQTKANEVRDLIAEEIVLGASSEA